MSDDIKPGDELSNMKLLTTLSLPNLTETHLQAAKHKIRLVAHPKGVLLTRSDGDTWLVYDACIQAVRKAVTPAPAEAEKPRAKAVTKA